MSGNSSWIKSGGGPLICMEKQLAPYWRGTRTSGGHSTNKIFANDYDRACSVSDYVGKISIDDQQALILGDMPLQTLIWETDSNLPILVRVFYADPYTDVVEKLNAMQNLDFSNPIEIIDFDIIFGHMIVFDSAYSGSDLSKLQLSFELPQGKYMVVTKQFEPDDRTSVLLHKFIPYDLAPAGYPI